MDWMKLVELAGPLLTGASKSQADQRHVTDAGNINRDIVNQRAVQAANQAALERAKYEDTRQAEAYKQAQMAQLAQNWRPTVRPSGVANISFVPGGGPSAAMLDRAKDLERMATIKMLGGDALPEVEKFTPTAAQEPSTLEKVMSILGTGATVAPSVLDAVKKKNGQAPVDYNFGGSE